MKPKVQEINCEREHLSYVEKETDKCIPILQRHLGEGEVESHHKEARGIFSNYFFNLKGESPTLKDTKKELQRLKELSHSFYRTLKNLSGPAEDALTKAWYDYNEQVGRQLTIPEELIDPLLQFIPLVNKAQEKLPGTLRWPENLTAERELIRELGQIYTKITGKKAKEGNYRAKTAHDVNSTEYEYTGPFFKLVEDIFYTLRIEKHTQGEEDEANNALGRAIDRALTK